MADSQVQIMEEQETVPAAVSESAAIFSLIERAAKDPNTDIDKMERLMNMHERMMARNAEKAFNEAMAAAQAEMPQVVRDADNDQTKSKYARYETISEAIQPIITKYGFSLSYNEGTPERDNCIRILCDVMHEGGHTKQFHADVPFDNVGMKGNANKTATHAYGSTKSYGKRYLKCDIFDVALKNEDDDGNAAGTDDPPINEEQLTEVRGLIEATESDIAKFCTYFKVQALPDLRMSQYGRAVASLKAKKGAQECQK